jgi:penicillin-binding protein 1C
MKILQRIVKWIKRHKFLLFLLFLPFILFFILDFIFPLPVSKLENNYSTVYLDCRGELLHVGLSPDDKYRIKLNLSHLSPYLVKGFTVYEDRWFYFHPGINPAAMARALFINVRKGRITFGASTISMQIARMIYNRPRNIGSKILEIFNAFQLEWKYSKNKLLEIYLNMVPMGGNIEGVGAASYFYFGKPASRLSFQEAAVLIGIPNNPNFNRPDKYPARAIKKLRSVLFRIQGKNGLPKFEKYTQIDAFAKFKKYANPYRCPHLIEANKIGGEDFEKTFSIDLNIQTFCENILKKHRDINISKGIANGAIIVIENKTGKVKAYAGSPDYYDSIHSGQVNGAIIPRSPGSALKPFIYARAIEKEGVTPQSLVLDIPKLYDDRYLPLNYNKKSKGLVTLKDALLHSLNIPAVRMEETLKDKGLSGLLKDNFPYERDRDVEKAGLSLPLGTFHLSLEEISRLYMALANEGQYRELVFYESMPNFSNIQYKQILHPGACFIVSDILSEYYRPDLPYAWEFSPHLARAALKTGTSFGLRDAWCLGYNPDYTVGVWIGNVNSQGSPYLIGAEIASPVFIEIFDFLTKNSDRWFKKPDCVETRKVCAVSGEKPGKYCKLLNTDYYIPGISSEKTCSIHRLITIRKKDKKEVCPYCMSGPESDYQKILIEQWPIEVFSYFRESGKKINLIPEHNPDCPHYTGNNGPKIITPSNHSTYTIRKNIPVSEQKISLKAFSGQDSEYLCWFFNNQFFQKSKPEEAVFITPFSGKHLISVIDSRGRGNSVEITIK